MNRAFNIISVFNLPNFFLSINKVATFEGIEEASARTAINEVFLIDFTPPPSKL